MTKSSEKAVLRVCVGGYDHSVVAVEAEIQSLKPSTKPKALKRLFADCEHAAPVRCVASRDGLLATAGHDEIIRLFNLTKMVDLGSLMQQQASISHLAFFGSSLLSAADDGSICIWQTSTWRCLATLKGHKSIITGLAVHPSGRLALSCSNDRSMIMWDLMKGKKAFDMKIKSGSSLLSWSPDGNLYSLACSNEARVFGADGSIRCIIEHPSRIHVLKFFDNERVVSGCEDGIIRCFTVDGALEIEFTGHQQRIRGLDVIPVKLGGIKARLLASASSDGVVLVWNPAFPEHPLAMIDLSLRITCLRALSSNRHAPAPLNRTSANLQTPAVRLEGPIAAVSDKKPEKDSNRAHSRHQVEDKKDTRHRKSDLSESLKRGQKNGRGEKNAEIRVGDGGVKRKNNRVSKGKSAKRGRH